MTTHCPECGQPSTRVLETRDHPLGIRRRHTCIDNHRWTTYEVCESALRGVGLSRIQSNVDRVKRGIAMRQKSEATRELVLYMLEHGHHTQEIAQAAEITEARVRQIRQASVETAAAPVTQHPAPASWICLD